MKLKLDNLINTLGLIIGITETLLDDVNLCRLPTAIYRSAIVPVPVVLLPAWTVARCRLRANPDVRQAATQGRECPNDGHRSSSAM